MNPDELRRRTQCFAIDAIRLCRVLLPTTEGRTFAGQLVRCSASVAANYRAVCRARSYKEFIAKIGVVLEEADEAQFWLELVVSLEVLAPDKVKPSLDEATALVAIF